MSFLFWTVLCRLAQKAGFPQELVTELHGSWYDPSNPVVCYDGNIR